MNSRTEKRSKSEGDVREGEAYLAAAPRYCLADAREKKVEPRALLAGLWPKGRRNQAARWRRAHPLGSALAGEGAGDGTEALLALRRLLARTRSVAAVLR